MAQERLIILTLIRYYLPGYRSGGPVRSIENMVDQLGDEFDFRIVTMNRDHVGSAPYRDIASDTWINVGKAKVYYASWGFGSLNKLIRLVCETAHDVLYLNSAFDPVFTLWPLLNRNMGRIRTSPIVLAPRGEFSEGALAMKRWKKTAYLLGARAHRFYRDIIWQASSQFEADDIRRTMGSVVKKIHVAGNIADKIVIAPDLGTGVAARAATKCERAREGDLLHVLFLSRISPTKNLDFALRVLGNVSAPLVFHVYGPLEDMTYWQQCRSLMASLPGHVQVKYVGEIEHAMVSDVMASYDLLFLPTHGENYGHAIAEALAAGTPALISDTTPWRNLEQAGVGWDLPLTSELPFARVIDYCAALDRSIFPDWRQRVRLFATERLIDPALTDASRRLFLGAAGRESGGLMKSAAD